MNQTYGDYVITETRLGLLLDHIITVGKKYPVSFDKKQFTESIGATPSSNGPADKLRDMIRYGLLSKNNQKYIISDLGKAVIHGGIERANAIDTIIRKIPLWVKLNDAVGPKPKIDAFTKAVKQITHADNGVIKKNINSLWNAFSKDIACKTKTPPYSNVSAILGKRRIPKDVQKSPDTNISPQREVTVPAPTQIGESPISVPANQSYVEKKEVETIEEKLPKNEKITGVSEDRTGLTEYLPLNEKLAIELGSSIKFEVKDASTIAVARFLIRAKEDGLLRGKDYETH
jgi:hypothetical protein